MKNTTTLELSVKALDSYINEGRHITDLEDAVFCVNNVISLNNINLLN